MTVVQKMSANLDWWQPSAPHLNRSWKLSSSVRDWRLSPSLPLFSVSTRGSGRTNKKRPRDTCRKFVVHLSPPSAARSQPDYTRSGFGQPGTQQQQQQQQQSVMDSKSVWRSRVSLSDCWLRREYSALLRLIQPDFEKEKKKKKKK